MAKAAVKADADNFPAEFARVTAAIAHRTEVLPTLPTTSTPFIISKALDTLPSTVPDVGLGLNATTTLLLDELCPALSGGQAGPRFFGLITGGVAPSAQLADHIVTSYDPCVQVHLPEETISTAIEARTLDMLLDLLGLSKERFNSNTFTTGATASNFLGLTLGREFVVAKVQERKGVKSPSGLPQWSVGEDGFGGVDVDVFSATAHASTPKAASMAGIGRSNVVDLRSDDPDQPCAFDLVALEKRLRENVGKRGSIVAMSAGEVNTGGFTPFTKEIRELCDKYDAWMHCDAAFGAFGALHPEFEHLSGDLELADSITADAHKWLNVPYDCAAFFSRDPTVLRAVTGPGRATIAYLSSNSCTSASAFPSIDPYRTLPSPLFVNVENSRRFRALPVYATLLSLGKEGYAEIFERNIAFARKVEEWMRAGGGQGGYEVLLPVSSTEKPEDFRTLNIVLFAPSATAPTKFQGDGGAVALCKAINKSRECYCTGTAWKGRGAIRLAVSNHATELERDFEIVVKVLEEVMRE
ncbi:hypothetical protein MNV49_006340 [Pseudohyphozyma bogoriensis]|nr:hypothetical protein MNV49_006340 [Pseudohyphozyma bogoriensis]